MNMDPDMALRHLREAVALVDTPGGVTSDRSHLETIATMVANLDAWLSAGGFLPTSWER
jgi:hypothetical protein